MIRRVAVMGIGNELNGDDAAGMLVVRALAQTNWSNENRLVIDAGLAPENFTGTLRRFRPDVVLLVDAAEMGEQPGAVAWVSWDSVDGWSGSTHTLPPSVIARYLVAELGCRVILVGIQPACVDFEAGVSETVRWGVSVAVKKIMDEF